MRRLCAALVLAVGIWALAGCGERGQTDVWRQKLILEVETPSGIVTGGSVVEVSVRWFSGMEKIASSNAVSQRSRGEASFVEVAPGKYLFALSVNEPLERTLLTFGKGAGDYRQVTAALADLRESRTLSPGQYPDLVTFGDVNDPKTVKLVDQNDLAASFGPGFGLRGMRLEIIGEGGPEGAVEKVLGWWCNYQKDNRRLSGSNDIAIKNNELANILAAGSFKIGECAK